MRSLQALAADANRAPSRNIPNEVLTTTIAKLPERIAASACCTGCISASIVTGMRWACWQPQIVDESFTRASAISRRAVDHRLVAVAARCRDEMSSKVDLSIPHPFGVRPSGNAFFADIPPIRSPGLGIWSVVDDERVLELLSFLDAKDLSVLMQASCALYAFCNADDVWRTLTLSAFGADWAYAYDWRTTYVRRATGRTGWSYCPIRVTGLFSDLLYKPHLCAAALPDSPAWLSFFNVPRESITTLTLSDFRARYETPCLPVLLTGLDKGEGAWPAYSKWTDEYLIAAFGGNSVHAAGFDMRLSAYLSYIRQASGQGAGEGAACPREEAPLYLFDKAFVAKAPSLAQDYNTPLYFQEDLFSVLGPSEGDRVSSSGSPSCMRPDYRWLIFGPKRSGSVFHKDPNGTRLVD